MLRPFDKLRVQHENSSGLHPEQPSFRWRSKGSCTKRQFCESPKKKQEKIEAAFVVESGFFVMVDDSWRFFVSVADASTA
jgi:hypothetical protein